MVLNRKDKRCSSSLTKCLKAGGVAIIPCDTIYGVVGTVPHTEEKIRTAKGRSENKPFIILLPSINHIGQFSSFEVPKDIKSLWPAPLTLIVPSLSGDTVAIRVPDDDFLISVMTLTGPLYSTSVNTSNTPALWRINDIVFEFEDKVDLIIDSGDLPNRRPSTIVNCMATPFKIVRDGACHVPLEVLRNGPNSVE